LTLLPQDDALRRTALIMFMAVPLLFGGIALVFGQDSNWDLRNYHWYDAYALVHGRFDQDMGAAQTPTFYNPTLDVPFFLVANVLSARAFSFLLGVLQGCNFILLYLLAKATLRLGEERAQVLVSGLIAFIGVTGGGHLSLVGAVFYDNIVSLLVFAAMAMIVSGSNLLQRGPMPAVLRRVLGAGFLVGCGVGLKLPTQVFAVGVCFGLLFIPGPFIRRFLLSFVCGLGVIAGFAVFGGWWMWELWTHYGNPLFPYFNDVIRSPWALPASYRDDRFIPKTVAQALLLPFRLFVDGTVAGEIGFRDARLLCAYVVLPATPVMVLIARVKSASETNNDRPAVDVFAARYLAAAFVLSYCVWLILFDIYRYIIPLEMLAPLVAVGCLAFWPLSWQRQLSLAIGLLGFMIITTRPGDWGHKPWAPSGKFVDVTVPPITDPATTMVLMTGLAPTAFVIPAFPPEIPFLRAQSYFVGPGDATRFNEVLHQRVAAHRGKIFLLRPTWDTWTAAEVLPGFALRLQANGCRPVPTNLDAEIELCALERTGSENPQSANP
jgi:hypothetical protein